jgi:hypothetical protein
MATRITDVDVAATELLPDDVAPAGGGAPAKFTDNAGPVIQIPRVIVLYWGAAWTAVPAPVPTSAAITSSIRAMLASAYMTGLAEYRQVGRGHLVASAVHTATSPANGFTDANVANFVAARIADGTVPGLDQFNQNVYVVVMPTGVNSSNTSFIGEHTYYTDAGGNRVRFAWITNNGSMASITSIISHEIAEAATDPEGSAILGVAGTCSQGGWCEISDICSFTAVRNGVTVQSFWSDAASACVVPDWPARRFPQTGVQFRGTVAARSSHRWFTFNWPEYLHVRWRAVPVTPMPGAAEVTWRTQIERASGAYVTYWITVTNLTARDVEIEGRYTILGISR